MESVSLYLGGLWTMLVGSVAIGIPLALTYMLPTTIAFIRRKPSKRTVIFVNIMFGWTIIGWIFAFIWAINDSSADKLVRIEQAKLKKQKA